MASPIASRAMQLVLILGSPRPPCARSCKGSANITAVVAFIIAAPLLGRAVDIYFQVRSNPVLTRSSAAAAAVAAVAQGWQAAVVGSLGCMKYDAIR